MYTSVLVIRLLCCHLSFRIGLRAMERKVPMELRIHFSEPQARALMECFHDKIRLPLPLKSSFPVNAQLDISSLRCSLTRISDRDRNTFSLAEGIVGAVEALEHRVVRCELALLMAPVAGSSIIPESDLAVAVMEPTLEVAVTWEEAVLAAGRFIFRHPGLISSRVGFLHVDGSPWPPAKVQKWGRELRAVGGWDLALHTAQCLEELACEVVPNAQWDDMLLDIWRAHPH